MRRTAIVALGLLAVALSAACRRSPAPPFEALGDDAMQRFRAAFDARPDATRVVALLSPT